MTSSSLETLESSSRVGCQPFVASSSLSPIIFMFFSFLSIRSISVGHSEFFYNPLFDASLLLLTLTIF